MLAFIAAIAASAALATATPAEPARSLFYVVSRVEVDAMGAIVAIEPPSATAPEVKAAVDANIRKLHFTPPKLEGKSVGGATWLRMQVCSVQAESGQQLAMRYFSTGLDWISYSPPVYPANARNQGASATFDVGLEVRPDGTAKLTKAKPVKIHGHLRDFLRAIEIWADEQRFHPEMVDGKPVGALVYTTFGWEMGKPVHVAELEAAQRRQEDSSRVEQEKNLNAGCEAILAGRPANAEVYLDGHPPEDRVTVRL